MEARKASRDIVASDWSPVRLTTGTAEGYVDPVLEWLSVTDRVISETDDWITIQCPWHEGHTQEGGHAVTLPLGGATQPTQTGVRSTAFTITAQTNASPNCWTGW